MIAGVNNVVINVVIKLMITAMTTIAGNKIITCSREFNSDSSHLQEIEFSINLYVDGFLQSRRC